MAPFSAYECRNYQDVPWCIFWAYSKSYLKTYEQALGSCPEQISASSTWFLAIMAHRGSFSFFIRCVPINLWWTPRLIGHPSHTISGRLFKTSSIVSFKLWVLHLVPAVVGLMMSETSWKTNITEEHLASIFWAFFFFFRTDLEFNYISSFSSASIVTKLKGDDFPHKVKLDYFHDWWIITSVKDRGEMRTNVVKTLYVSSFHYSNKKSTEKNPCHALRVWLQV